MDNACESPEPSDPGQRFEHLVAAIGAAKLPARELAVEALAEVRRGVMTGEGPTACGRVHFSRTLDADDAAQCARILTAAGGEAGEPVSRDEAEILFDIHEAAREREDDGLFDDLFAKAIAHHLLAAAGCPVPPRQAALAPSTQVAAWATLADFEILDREIAAWRAARLSRRLRMLAALEPVAAMLLGASAAPVATTVGDEHDRAA